MPDTTHYLRDAKTRNKIELETLETRISVQVKEDDSKEIEKVVSEIKKMAPKAKVQRISSKVYEIEYPSDSPDTDIKEMTGRINATIKNVIPYNVYKAKDRLGRIYLTDEIIVTFSGSTSGDLIKLLEEKYNLIKLEELDNEPLICVFAQKPGKWDNPIEVANRMEQEKGITIAEPSLVNKFVHTDTTLARPTDNFFRKQWQLEAPDQNDVPNTVDVNARDAWDRLEGGGDPNIVIAVVDFGFDITHPDLKNQLVNFDFDRFDFSNTGPKYHKPNTIEEDHGTKCAGVAVAERNEIGVVGIAYGCKLLPVCCPDSPTNTEIFRIFRAIKDQVDVISCSYAPDIETTATSRTLFELMERMTKPSEGRRKQGCVICFAAGNSNLPLNEEVIGLESFFGGQLSEPFTGRVINPFASHPDVIAVAASNANNQKAFYSNWGEEVWVCAPSNDKTSDGTIIDPSITTTSSTGNLSSGLYTNEFGGTSSATPLVAGIAALVLSGNPNLTAMEVKDILKETADKINLHNTTDGKYDNNGHSKWFGYGKVNAGKAVRRAIQTRS